MGSKKESALDLGRFIDKEVRVKLTGGREGTSSGSWGGGGGGGCAMGPPAVADAARRAQQREHCGRTAALRSSERSSRAVYSRHAPRWQRPYAGTAAAG